MACSVFEVGPRDGLQSENQNLSVSERIRLIKFLIDAALPDIEVGSFVRADRIPQLQSTHEVLRGAQSYRSTKKNQTKFWAFIPNNKGLVDGIEAGIDGASFFVASSDTFCQKNVNRTQAEILSELKELVRVAKKNKIKTRIYLSTLIHCPYEGLIKPTAIVSLVQKLQDLGASEIALSDTTGWANPKSISRLLELLLKKHRPQLFALHLHDTRGLALANVYAALDFGIKRFDASVGGMGGCPYAPGASGNLASEDLCHMLSEMGLLKNIDLRPLAAAGLFAEKLFGHTMPSKMLRVLTPQAEALLNGP